MVIEPSEAAELILAVAKDNTFNRGRKNRMEAWKVMFGVYVSARFKPPIYTLAGLRWKLNYNIVYSSPYLRNLSIDHEPQHVSLPVPNIYSKKTKEDEVAIQNFSMVFVSFEGDEEAFKRDFTILRMFASEWGSVVGRGLD